MKEIKLTKGKIALVDDEDYDLVSRFKWYALNSRGIFYACRRRDGGIEFMHRLIMNNPSGLSVDHVDGNSLNNQRVNLRICSHAENMRNRKTSEHTSKYLGVSQRYWYSGGRMNSYYVAQIQHGNSGIYIGSFKTEEDAALAYNEMAIKLHGDFAKLNDL